MKLDRKRIVARTGSVELDAWPRIFPARHVATPLGSGFGSSQFSSPSKAFRVLYAAEDFPTAFAEGVVRDRFEGKQRRYLYRPQLETLVASEISTGRALQLVDLTGAAAYELGVDTDAKAARDHAKGQRFAEALHRDTDVDGMLFSSRLTGALCAAIFDRAAAKLSATTPVALPMVGALPAELTRLGITVRRRRAMS